MPKILSWMAPFFGFLLLNAAVAALGAVYVLPLPDWYTAIPPADWALPDRWFGPVWGVLYFLMAAAAACLWRQRNDRPDAAMALALYGAQLFANALWAPMFFGKGWVAMALADFSLLMLLLAGCLYCAFRACKSAGWLLTPYFLWGCYAYTLNLYVWGRMGS